MSRRDDRKKEITVLIEEGRQAALAGRHRQTCPQEYIGSMNRVHWLNGHADGTRELRASEPVAVDEGVVDAQRFSLLRNLAGHVENGTAEVVSFFQSEEDRQWYVKVGNLVVGSGSSLSAAIDSER